MSTEIEACKHWLDEQIRLVNPKAVVTLGRFSMSRWFPGQSISRIHGRPIKRDGMLIFPMYHPAAALHQQNLRATLEEDMKKLPEYLEALKREQTPAQPQAPQSEPEPQQLSLF